MDERRCCYCKRAFTAEELRLSVRIHLPSAPNQLMHADCHRRWYAQPVPMRIHAEVEAMGWPEVIGG